MGAAARQHDAKTAGHKTKASAKDVEKRIDVSGDVPPTTALDDNLDDNTEGGCASMEKTTGAPKPWNGGMFMDGAGEIGESEGNSRGFRSTSVGGREHLSVIPSVGVTTCR